MLRVTGLLLALSVLRVAPLAHAEAPATKYPIVFAHGLAGFDDILGYDYWGNDGGNFVMDPCDAFLEISCNGDVNDDQRSYVSQVAPFQSSEVRGTQLANNIESYMATSGASYVNVISHSMGGIDTRKAAKVLYDRLGYRAVMYHVSISTPHRGSPVAKYMLDNFRDTLLVDLARMYGDAIYGSGNDVEAALKQLVYDDYEVDGVYTGMMRFNENYPPSGTYIRSPRSILTAQDGWNVNPALWLLSELVFDIDGDGYCAGDGDDDGAGGCGDGNAAERDDDGLVGINSQQQGYRLYLDERFGALDRVRYDSTMGYLSDLNAPTVAQSTSLSSVVNQDHLDVIGVGPDTFDEEEFYAAIEEYIAFNGY